MNHPVAVVLLVASLLGGCVPPTATPTSPSGTSNGAQDEEPAPTPLDSAQPEATPELGTLRILPPIPLASLSLDGRRIDRHVIEGLPAGSHRLSMKGGGFYEEFDLEVDLKGGETLEITLPLTLRHTMLQIEKTSHIPGTVVYLHIDEKKRSLESIMKRASSGWASIQLPPGKSYAVSVESLDGEQFRGALEFGLQTPVIELKLGEHPQLSPHPDSSAFALGGPAVAPSHEKDGYIEFDIAAVRESLSAAARRSESCWTPGQPTGVGMVSVVFKNSGAVRSVTIVTGKFVDTVAGKCVTEVFLRAKVPRFSGVEKTVAKRFELGGPKL